jgi:type II secretory ATPase GspE/PulE/Tfp pilus assembly ATPase PilB-like protein
MSRSPADTTANMLRDALAEAAARAPSGQFNWPTPPYYEFVDSAGALDAEECLLVFQSGARANGSLRKFLPDDSQLEFRAANGALSSVPFSALLGLQLLRPATVRRQVLPFNQLAQDGQEPSDRQPFSVQLANGKTFQGETLGHVSALCGLFLYLPEDDDTVMRWFLPAQATKNCRIGKPLGEMLVDENLATPEAVDAALDKQMMLRTQRLGEYLTRNQIVSPEQLAAALKQQSAQPVQKLGETLVELGYLSPAELSEALAIEARNRSIPLGQILADMGVVEPEIINTVMSKKLGIPFVNLRTFRIAPDVLKRIAPPMAHRYQIIPVSEAESALVVALDNPMNRTKLEELRFATGAKLIPVMASAEDIRYALERNYGPARQMLGRGPGEDVGIEQLSKNLAEESGEELDDQQAAQADSTLVRLVNKMILDAIEQKASDIHIESNAGTKNTRIRFRKDGSLVNYLELPSRLRKAVISRIKVMSQLDITERRKPQDGKLDFSRFGPAQVELRVAVVPTANGLEDVVMRVLAAATPVPLDQLGFDPPALDAIKHMMSRPHGLFLVCGPTGSGKTTTLHSVLGFLNTPDLKIWTAEDPIEITQAGLRQVQVHAKIGWNFAAALRAFMRADPDVIMVGEMRDAETTKSGVEASLTGHLVLSTLHTNSAAESVVRLLDLGMDPFNFADALLGVLAQRLVRRLCGECKAGYTPSAAELEKLAAEYCVDTPLEPEKVLAGWRKQYPKATLYRAKGCERCDKTGYKGRMGIYELLVADPQIKRLIQVRSPVAEIAAKAISTGMRTLKQDGMDKVLRGLTDMNQVRGV